MNGFRIEISQQCGCCQIVQWFKIELILAEEHNLQIWRLFWAPNAFITSARALIHLMAEIDT